MADKKMFRAGKVGSEFDSGCESGRNFNCLKGCAYGILWAEISDSRKTAFFFGAAKQSAPDTVRPAAQNKIGRFSKQDIRELCPSLSLSSVEGSLRKLVEEGELKREGKGKGTFYFRT